MPADVLHLAAARARRERSTRPARVPYAVQAAPGSVALVVPSPENELSPEQAYELAIDLLAAVMEAGR